MLFDRATPSGSYGVPSGFSKSATETPRSPANTRTAVDLPQPDIPVKTKIRRVVPAFSTEICNIKQGMIWSTYIQKNP